jgi:hypothetical protein
VSLHGLANRTVAMRKPAVNPHPARRRCRNSAGPEDIPPASEPDYGGCWLPRCRRIRSGVHSASTSRTRPRRCPCLRRNPQKNSRGFRCNRRCPPLTRQPDFLSSSHSYRFAVPCCATKWRLNPVTPTCRGRRRA